MSKRSGDDESGRKMLNRTEEHGKKSDKFVDFGSGLSAMHKSTQFFSDESNLDDWRNIGSADGITAGEYDAIHAYTGESGLSYHVLNSNLYTKNLDDMSPSVQDAVKSVESGLDKFVLGKGINVTRQCDFKIFGAHGSEKLSIGQIKKFIKENADSKDGTLMNKGFLSFGANNHGAGIAGTGLVIHAKVPPSIGAGAYVNPISKFGGGHENEWLFNAGARFKFDVSSLRVGSDGKIHINCVWKGRQKIK